VTPCQSQAVSALPIGRFDASPLSRPSSLVPPSLAGESPTPRFNSAGCLPLPPPHRKSRLLPPSSLSSTSTISWPAAALPSQRACFSPHSPTAPLQSDLSPLLPATADGDPSAPSLPPPPAGRQVFFLSVQTIPPPASWSRVDADMRNYGVESTVRRGRY
jgi:hypothetical protein